jgi:hypothetical protein
MSLHIYNISSKYLSNILSNKDFMPKKEVKIVRSATLFCDVLKRLFFKGTANCYMRVGTLFSYLFDNFDVLALILTKYVACSCNCFNTIMF